MQISKKRISNKVFSRMFLLFYEIFRNKISKQDFVNIINEIFSLKEQVMIIKRIAIYYLANRGIGVNEIAEKLGVSPGTSSKFTGLANGSKYLSDFFIKKQKREKFFNLLNDLYYELISPPTKYGTDWMAGWKIEIDRQKRKNQTI
ncbi:MAG: hypothetical protein ABH812_02225 [bacterium]